MGSVYLAEQREPIQRRAAVKVIKRGMDSREVIARFESERQALALMNHPNIARVFDAGTTESGLPFFAMENVAGIPITEYCDRNRMDARARLGLFIEVCQAVQHAHQKGIIHRDIKPSNVLVSIEDDRPRPKVIDFGVAKAINQRLTERTLFTQQGILIGTPSYMSPEQAEPTALDIDTRTDIYSLGVLLYELMVGALPFDPQRLRSAGYAEMQRIIREEEPPKPSTRVRTLGETTPTIADHRKTDPQTLQRQLRGDLDWIALKALEKDRARRYQTATDLAADVQRHLSNEPVAAGPPSAAYRFKKLVRRNRGLFAAAAAIFFAVLAGGIFSTILYLRAERARRERNQQLVHQYVSNGMRLADEGNVTEALRWLVEALRLEGRSSAAKEAHRYRIGSVLERCPIPVRVWTHRDVVSSAVFSPDGARVATGSRDGTARVWSATTGKPVMKDLNHGAAVVLIKFSPDGRLLATAGRDGRAIIWDSATGRVVAPPLKHTPGAGIWSVSFNPDGTRVVTANEEKVAHVWDTNTGKSICVIPHDAEVRHAIFSRDGKVILTGGMDDTARLSDSGTCRQLTPPMKHSSLLLVALSPDGMKVATTGEGGTARIWDATTGKPLTEPLYHAETAGDATWPVFSSDGRLLATCASDTIHLWDVVTGRQAVSPLRGSSTIGIGCGKFSPDGRMVVAASDDGRVQLFRIDTGQVIRPSFVHSIKVNAFDFDPSGRYILTAGGDSAARLWDLAATEASTRTAMLGESVFGTPKFTSDGRLLVTRNSNPKRHDWFARIWDAASGEPISPPLRHGQELWRCEFSHDGHRIITGSSGDIAMFRVWDSLTGEPFSGPIPGYLCSSVDPAKDRILACSENPRGQARIWDIVAGRYLTPPMFHPRGIFWGEFSPPTKLLATGGSDGTARLWNSETGVPAGVPLKHESSLFRVTFSPDGSRLVTASFDGKAVVWDVRTSRVLSAMQHEAWVTDVTFSPDGRRLLSATSSGSVRIWDSISGTPSAATLKHRAYVPLPVFSRDGQWILTGSHDGTARIWETDTGEPLTAAIHHGTRLYAAFSPDSRYIVTGSDDRVLRWWPIPKSLLPLEDLELLAQFLTGERMHGAVPVRLSAEQLSAAWVSLAKDHPDLFETEAARVIAWHRRRADELTAAHRWSDAVTHLDQVLSAPSARSEDFAFRGMANAELERWKEAAADHERSIQIRPWDAELRYRLGVIQLKLSDSEGYRTTSKALLDRLAKTGNPDQARWSARACSLSDSSGVPASQLLSWAQTPLEVEPDKPEHLVTLAAALYRSGKLAEAAKSLEKAMKSQGYEEDPRTPLLFAMIGRQPAKVREISDFSRLAWWQRAELELLRSQFTRGSRRLIERQAHR